MLKKTRFFQSTKVRILLVVMGGILLYISGVIIYPAGVQEQQDATNAIRGELIPFNLDFSKPFVVNLGNNILSCSAQDLANGFDPTNLIFIGSGWPFQITFNNNKISISATIVNSKNETIA